MKAERPFRRRICRYAPERLLEATSEDFRALVALAVFTGARQSELLGLRWFDADVRRHPPHPQSASRKTHDRPAELVALKTDAAARDVELRPRAVRELGAHRRARFALGHAKQDDLVFATVDGKPLHFASVSGRLRRAAKRAGLGHVAFHDLRRTAASHLIRAGADPVRAARTLGHSNPAMTLDVYARDFAEAARDGELERKLNARGFGT